MDREAIFAKFKQRMGRPTKQEILDGEIVPVLFKLAWPMMVASLLQTAYNLVDTIWLGRLPGAEATLSVSAISLAWPFVFLLLSIQLGLGTAAIAMISQHTGAKKYEEANHDTGQLFFLFIVLSIILGAVGFLVAEDFLNFLTGHGDMVPFATDYLQVIFIGFPILLTFAAFSFSLRAWGDTLTPTMVMAVSVLLNIALDPLFIFGIGPFPRLGIQGAAIATVLARYVGAVIAVYMLYTNRVGIRVKLSYLKPDFTKLKKFLAIGTPATLSRIEESVGFIVLTGLLAMLPYQEEVLAAYGIGGRVINITFVVLMGIMMAVSTMVGQALGNDNTTRAERTTDKAMKIMVFFMIVISLLLVIFRDPIMRFFIPGRPRVIEIGAMYLMILAIGGPFFGIYEAVSGALNGSGHTGQQFGLSMTRLWGLRIPMILIFAFVLALNSTGAWMAIAFSNVGAGLAAYWVYKKGWWKEKIIDKESLLVPKIKKFFNIEEEKDESIQNDK